MKKQADGLAKEFDRVAEERSDLEVCTHACVRIISRLFELYSIYLPPRLNVYPTQEYYV
jgi:hypothetical protein